jgi:hypothetical protein
MQDKKCDETKQVRNKESIEIDIRNVLTKLEEVGSLRFSESFTPHEIDVLVEILTQ